jgi:hypothetical protein
MSSSNPESRILQFLKDNAGEFPAKLIARSLNLERTIVNRILYEKLLKADKVLCNKATPPLWSYAKSDEDSEAEAEEVDVQNIVFVDLGNVHDILQKLESYAGHDCKVYAFADCAFNGYGVNPIPKNKDIEVFQTKDDHKNAADVEMIWKAAEIVMNMDEERFETGIRFIIFTRDNGFRSLKTILERYKAVREVLFVQTWQQAREFIE